MRAAEEPWIWLDEAEADLRGAKVLRDEGIHNLACFHSQQVAEKALKAFLYFRGADLVLGHSVQDLCERVAAVEPSLATRCEEWGQLDLHYLATRYPDVLAPGSHPSRSYSRAAAELAIESAGEVVTMIRDLMGPRPAR